MYYVIALICIVVFFQILMYKSVASRARKQHTNDFWKLVITVEIKNELVGKIDKFNSCILCNSSEKSNSRRLI